MVYRQGFEATSSLDLTEAGSKNYQTITRAYSDERNLLRTTLEKEKNRQLACKPGSVWLRFDPERGSHSSGTTFACRLAQPTRMTRPETGCRHCFDSTPRHPYSVLLPVGFTMPPLLPAARWALTPPFHPYHLKGGGLLSAALSLGSPPPDVIRHRVSVEPGLSSPYRLSTLVKRGCPANWHALLRRVQDEKPTENRHALERVRRWRQRYGQKTGAKSVSYPSSLRWPCLRRTAPSRPISSELFAAAPQPPVRTAIRCDPQ